MRRSIRQLFFHRFLAALALVAGTAGLPKAFAQEPLFLYTGPPDTQQLPAHAVAGQKVRLNPRAFQAPKLEIELFGETRIALRLGIERHKGETVWLGHLEGNPGDAVVLTRRGQRLSGFIQLGLETYRISGSSDESRLLMLDLKALPGDDAADLPDGGGYVASPQADASAQDAVQQDLLVVYNQAACDSADPTHPGNDCAQLQADIVTAVADTNSAYAASGIGISMNLVGMALTSYTGTTASQALYDLAGTSDGQMDEIHALRNSLGADIVSMVYRGEGCGIGYLSSSASTAFNLTDEPCLVGNRTMAHEIAHNQGAHHDRLTLGGGSSNAYNYGFRRCNDSSADNLGSPYFRTVLSYSCSGAARVGRFSNPNVNYSGVPQGVDPALDPARGSWNARVMNDSASNVAAFRAAAAVSPPAAPGNLSAAAAGPDAIDLLWQDNANDESAYRLQSSPDASNWTTIAMLGANVTAYIDNGLPPETTRHYRVRGENGAGVSGWSNPAGSTTEPLPPEVVDLALGELSVAGSVSGTAAATHAQGGALQTITEAGSGGGPPSRRKQAYEHAWSFDAYGGAGGVVATVVAWVSGSEGADFWYSLDGGATRHAMFTVSDTAAGASQVFTLPAGTSGAVRIGVNDASQSGGESVDSLYVDHLRLTSYTEAGSPPPAPSGMSVTGTTANTVSLSFMDNSADEFGFELRRATANPNGNCAAGTLVATLPAAPGTGPVSHDDDTAASGTSYWYWARSFNGAGDNGQCSNTAAATTNTSSAPSITLAVSGFKVKGVSHADLSWSGASTAQVDIYRDGAKLVTVANSGAWQDNTGLKGGGSLSYRVCNAASSTCSDTQTIVF